MKIFDGYDGTEHSPRCMVCRRGLAMRILSVRPSVCLPNAEFVTKRKKVVHVFFWHMKDHLGPYPIVLWQEEWLVRAIPSTVTEILDRPPPLERNRRFWTDVRSSPSVVAPSEKSSINTNRKSTTRFINEPIRWSSYVAPKPPPKGAQKRKTVVFSVKSHFAWRKRYKVSLCENCQR